MADEAATIDETLDPGTSEYQANDIPQVSAEDYEAAEPGPGEAADASKYREQLEAYFRDENPDEEDDEEAEQVASNEDDEEAAEQPNDLTDFTPELLGTALQFGIDEQNARAFGTPQALRMALTGMAHAFRAGQQAAGQRGDVASAADDDADDVTSAGAPGQGFADDLDPEIYDPVIVKHIRSLQQEVATLRAQVQLPQQQQFYEWFDEQASQAGIESLGTGPVNTLQRANADERVALLQTFESLRGQFPRDTKEQLLQRAIAARYPQHVLNQQKKQLSDKRRQRAQGAIGRPSRKPQDAGLDDETATLRELEGVRQKFLRENGDED